MSFYFSSRLLAWQDEYPALRTLLTDSGIQTLTSQLISGIPLLLPTSPRDIMSIASSLETWYTRELGVSVSITASSTFDESVLSSTDTKPKIDEATSIYIQAGVSQVPTPSIYDEMLLSALSAPSRPATVAANGTGILDLVLSNQAPKPQNTTQQPPVQSPVQALDAPPERPATTAAAAAAAASSPLPLPMHRRLQERFRMSGTEEFGEDEERALTVARKSSHVFQLATTIRRIDREMTELPPNSRLRQAAAARLRRSEKKVIKEMSDLIRLNHISPDVVLAAVGVEPATAATLDPLTPHRRVSRDTVASPPPEDEPSDGAEDSEPDGEQAVISQLSDARRGDRRSRIQAVRRLNGFRGTELADLILKCMNLQPTQPEQQVEEVQTPHSVVEDTSASLSFTCLPSFSPAFVDAPAVAAAARARARALGPGPGRSGGPYTSSAVESAPEAPARSLVQRIILVLGRDLNLSATRVMLRSAGVAYILLSDQPPPINVRRFFMSVQPATKTPLTVTPGTSSQEPLLLNLLRCARLLPAVELSQPLTATILQAFAAARASVMLNKLSSTTSAPLPRARASLPPPPAQISPALAGLPKCETEVTGASFGFSLPFRFVTDSDYQQIDDSTDVCEPLEPVLPDLDLETVQPLFKSTPSTRAAGYRTALFTTPPDAHAGHAVLGAARLLAAAAGRAWVTPADGRQALLSVLTAQTVPAPGVSFEVVVKFFEPFMHYID